MDEQVVEWRRHLHRHPEVSFEEHETSAWIAARLSELGVTVSRPTETSVLGRLGSGDGPVVALRADIDALPIHEESGVEFASERPGAMHACGHDGHTAMLLGAAAELAALGAAAGEVRFIFQHAEELAPGGARELIAAGVMEGVDFVYGCHLWTPLEYGKVAAVPGDFMAAADFFQITITGKGGHAGLPHTAVDTVAAAAAFVGQVQHIVSRRIDPLQPAVVTIGSIRAGDAPNVIPGEAVLLGHVALLLGGRARADPGADRGDRPGRVRGARRVVRARLHVRLQAGRQRCGRRPSWCARSSGDELSELDPIMGGDDFSAYLGRGARLLRVHRCGR